MATLRQLAASLSDSGKGLYTEFPYPNRDQELAGITRDMKQLAMEHQLLLIVSSSLSRNVEHRHARTPFLSGLRESGMIGENADDLTFSGERPPEAGFFESVTRIIGEHGFTLNRRKTRIQHSTSRQVVTGIVANSNPNLNREYKRKLRAQLHSLEKLRLSNFSYPLSLAYN